MVRFREMKIGDIKKFLNKVGVEADLPEVETAEFAVTGDKENGNMKVIIRTNEEELEIPVPMQNYISYLKYGRYDAQPKKNKKTTNGKERGPRGEKTMLILNEIKKFISENGEVKMGELWKELNSQGIVKHRPQLFQIVKKYCDVEYIETGKRREMIIKGVKN